ncbi:hypothetical protein PF006_g26331 [Phytophthora fragariae]|uniref:Uncharacterized protein n=1 Tax=Phytophthora fragariae TaxID=53985 RepID=A0A6A3QWP9_9STRA|nr:hypothetical protein PF006_g26331 [Phytophthora fragariae]
MSCWDVWHKEWKHGKLIPVDYGNTIRIRKVQMYQMNQVLLRRLALRRHLRRASDVAQRRREYAAYTPDA